MNGYKKFIAVTVLLSVVSLFIEQSDITAVLGISGGVVLLVGQVIDYVLMACVIGETVYDIVREKYKAHYFKAHWASFTFTVVFTLLFLYSKFIYHALAASSIAALAVLLRNFFTVLRMYSRMKRLKGYVERLTVNPAQTILFSFAGVILAGTLLLMMGFTTVNGKGLPFLGALFTATSCVCVTGLTVVDTAASFTFWGHLVLIVLIQIGGLGLMLLSYFVIFVIRRRVSLADKLMLSYMLSDDDTASIYVSMVRIVLTTAVIEAVGSVLLFIGFVPLMGFSLKTAWYAVFHSVSAFCNAGFALFDGNLEQFVGSPYLLFVLALLIITGGIGFACITNLRAVFDSAVHRQRGDAREKLTLNTKVVLTGTLILLVAGTLLYYILEYDNSMRELPITKQYLNAFFQSVTFRTAGFNSVSLGSLRPATYLVFSIFMFIGAASGSTAGGTKVNTITVLGAALYSYLKGQRRFRIGRAEISGDKVFQASVLFIANCLVMFAGIIALTMLEGGDIARIVFEVCSALGTAGVTAGLTPDLCALSKVLLILCMFWGRVGGLTVLSSASTDSSEEHIRWPQADISIG